MTVAELIKKLSTFDPDLTVLIGHEGDAYDISTRKSAVGLHCVEEGVVDPEDSDGEKDTVVVWSNW